MREFDLNIEKVLENWTVAYATTGLNDVTRSFETELTKCIGKYASQVFG